MRRRALIASVCLAVLLCLPSAAKAQETGLVSVSAGLFDIPDRGDVAQIDVDWRSKPLGWGLQLQIGLMINADSGGYVFVGARRDVPLAERWDLSLGLAAGAYEPGDGLDLGGPVEFRSSIELFRQLGDRRRLGLGFYHLSHTGIYGDVNPGSNSLVLVYGFRLG